MAGDFTFNVALGREVELYNRVNGNDPAASALICVVLRQAGISDDADLKDCDTLAAVLALGTTDEATNTGYSRKTLTDADLAVYTVDDVRDRIVLSLPLLTFATISAGDTWEKLLVCYDADTAAGTDSDIVPITAHVLRMYGAAVVPNGSDVVIDLTNGFVQAQ